MEEKLHRAALADEQTKEQIIRELASNADETLPLLLDRIRFGHKGGAERIAVRAIRMIGYPCNSAAIPALIEQVSNLNAPAWREAAQALLDMGTDAIVPALIRVLLGSDQKIQHWGETVNGICQMITISDANSNYALLCGPAIAYLLGQKSFASDSDLDSGYLLAVLKKAGTAQSVYALPALITLAQREGKSDLGKEVSEFIISFDATVLKPYLYGTYVSHD